MLVWPPTARAQEWLICVICGPKIKMRPGPATRAAFAAEMFRLLSHRTRQSARASKPRSRGTHISPRTPQIQSRRRSFGSESAAVARPAAQSYQWGGHRGGRNAQCSQRRAMTRSLKTSNGSPSRTAGTASFRNLGSALEHLTHALAVLCGKEPELATEN